MVPELKQLSIRQGKVSNIYHDSRGYIRTCLIPFPPPVMIQGVIDRNSLPSHIQAVSCSEDGEVMGIRHLYYPIEGVQFHPESIMSYQGDYIIKNFLALKIRGQRKACPVEVL